MTVEAQLDMFADLEQAEAEVRAEEYRVNGWRTERHGAPLQPLLAGSEQHTPALWIAAFEQWRRDHGSFGCIPRCHTWQLNSWGELGMRMTAEVATEYEGGPCVPATFVLDLGCTAWGHDRLAAWRDERDGGPDHHQLGRCSCVRLWLERAACLGCGWWGPIRSKDDRLPDHDPALDAVRHVWPDVDSKPSIRSMPQDDEKAKAKWVVEATALYGQDWIDDRGPIWTERNSIAATRHVPARTPWGGWDLARLAPDADMRPATERNRRFIEEDAAEAAAYRERVAQRVMLANTVTAEASPAYV